MENQAYVTVNLEGKISCTGLSGLLSYVKLHIPHVRINSEWGGSECSASFSEAEGAKLFAEKLQELGIRYNIHDPVARSPDVPSPQIPAQGVDLISGFHNDYSQVKFIGNYNSVEEVIASDERELNVLGGSFESIAERMKAIIDFAVSSPRLNFHLFDPNFTNEIIVTFYARTHDSEYCPYEHCPVTWRDLVKIKNSRTGRELTLNKGTEHLAREHHLLEKGNEYGITAGEFYKHFMQD